MTEQEALNCHERGQQAQADGRHEPALAHLQLAAQYFEAEEGVESPDLANILADQADSLLELCRYQEAEGVARRAKEIVDGIRDRLDTDTRAQLTPRIFGLWGRTLRELGRYEEAAGPLLEGIREAEAGFGPQDPEVGGHLNNYGILCKYWGKFDEGERVYRRALAILEEKYGSQSPETATVYHNLGGLEHSRGEYAKKANRSPAWLTRSAAGPWARTTHRPWRTPSRGADYWTDSTVQRECPRFTAALWTTMRSVTERSTLRWLPR